MNLKLDKNIFDTISLDGHHEIYWAQNIKEFTLSFDEFKIIWDLHPAEFHTLKTHGKEVKTPRWQQAYGKDYKYNDKKLLIGLESYFIDDTHYDGFLYTYEYDHKGRATLRQEYTLDSVLSGKSIYEYDNNGKVIQEKTYKADGSQLVKYESTYDDHGNLIEIKEKIFNSGNTKYIFKYNKKGDLIEKEQIVLSSSYSGNGIIADSKTVYQYNRKDNCYLKYEYLDGRPSAMIEIEIEYLNQANNQLKEKEFPRIKAELEPEILYRTA